MYKLKWTYNNDPNVTGYSVHTYTNFTEAEKAAKLYTANVPNTKYEPVPMEEIEHKVKGRTQ